MHLAVGSFGCGAAAEHRSQDGGPDRLPYDDATERNMSALYARSVFFVADADRSLRFYTEELGFALDWDSKDGVFQVSLMGFEVILNQVGERTQARVGHGRVFIGLEDDQGEPLRKHFVDRRIPAHRVEWGRPTLVIKDVDENEMFFWMPRNDFSGFAMAAIE
jgi:catechol 2,3-dioxygenase-like lactoylglutathione lyase family enzyme